MTTAFWIAGVVMALYWGAVLGNRITIWKYSTLGIGHPDKIQPFIRQGMTIDAACRHAEEAADDE